MNKEYLIYLIKSKKSQCVALVIFYAIGVILSSTLQSTTIDFIATNTAVSSVILAVSTTALVPITYSYIHNKKAVDTYFSLPISRKEMLLTSQLFIDISTLLPFLISLTISVLIGHSSISNISIYIMYAVIAIVAVIAYVAFETSVFAVANSTVDGIVMMLAYLVLPVILFLVYETFMIEYVTGVNLVNDEQFVSYISLPFATCAYEIHLAKCFGGLCKNCVIFNKEFVVFIVNVVVHCIIAIYGLRKNYINRKVERAETISNNFFSYPFIIYAYAFGVVCSVSLTIVVSGMGQIELDTEWLVILFVILIAFLIANFVYRRKIKIYIKDILFYLLTVVITLAFSYFAFNTKGFGISLKYDHNPSSIAIKYECCYDQDELKDLIPNEYVDQAIGIMINGYVSKEEMENKKEFVEYIDKLRNEAIESYYSYGSYGYLEILTNCGPFNENSADDMIEHSKDLACYNRSPKIDLKEILKYKDNLQIILEIYDENYSIEYIDITDSYKTQP